MNKTIKISGKTIGEKSSCFIIAEAGVNHNGKLDLALKLIDQAASSGADAIKFQTFKAVDVTINQNKMADYQKKNLKYKKNQIEMLRDLELPDSFYPTLIERCKKKRIIFLSTPHGGENSVDFLEKYDLPLYKIGSGDLTNLPFLEYISKKKKPILLSTGMSYLNEVIEAVKIINKFNKNLVLLHCTTNYPTLLEEVNLKAMQTMQKKLNVLIGYSDHTSNLFVPSIAVAMGACVIEKHFTLDKSMLGPDHAASIEQGEFKKMVDMIRETEKIMGEGVKKPTKSEIKTAKIARKSIVAIIDIKKGDLLTKKALYIKRPGTGILPKYLNNLIGHQVKGDIPHDSLIRKESVEWKLKK
jgi:N,N'-diacetyllegionaminate synthase